MDPIDDSRPNPDTATLRIRNNLEAIHAEVSVACQRANRDPRSVTILPVTKYVDINLVRQLHTAGGRDIGESTIQETLRKREGLVDLCDMHWHLIGHLQRNKVSRALEYFDTIHSLDSRRLAQTLDRRLASRPREGVHFYVQVNVGGESAKYGLPPNELDAFLDWLMQETAIHSRVAGLMAVAPRSEKVEGARPYFRQLRELRDRGVDRGLLPKNAGLSMGMSRDFTVAIEEGATVVRIGSRLFEGLPSRRRNKPDRKPS